MAELDRNRLKNLVKVQLTSDDSFLRARNFLRRVGINPRGTNNLFQTCHILRCGNDYYICHFKELFWLDGRENHMDELDVERRNKIISLLVEKGMIMVDLSDLHFSRKAANTVFIVPYAEMDAYALHPKYRFKRPRKPDPYESV